MKKAIIFLFFYYLIFISHAQEYAWAFHLGNSNVDFGSDILKDQTGNTYLTGQFGGTVDFDPGPGTHNLIATGGVATFIAKYNPSGNILWAMTIATNYSSNKIIIDNLGNLYITGRYQGTVDFDPGSGVFNLTGSGGIGYDVFILKLDSSGNFIWAKGFGGTNDEEAFDIIKDITNNIFIVGRFNGSCDFDPGPSVYPLASNGSDDMFVLKLDAAGNFVYAKSAGGTSYDYAYAITACSDGSVCVTGKFRNTVDFDPGTGVYNLSATGIYYDFFIWKLDVNGDLLWIDQFSGSNSGAGNAIVTDESDNIYLGGSCSGYTDFDPGSDTLYMNTDPGDAFIVKISSTGNLIWAKHFGAFYNTEVTSICLDTLGNIYSTGTFGSTGPNDFDPGPAEYVLSCNGAIDIFVSKLDPAGNFLWAMNTGGEASSDDKAPSLYVSDSADVYITGQFEGTADFNPDSLLSADYSSYGLTDIFVLKLKQDYCANLALLVDTMEDVSCVGSGFATVLAIGGYTPYTYTWNTSPPTYDSTVLFNGAGIYTVTVTDALSCLKSATYLINGVSAVSGFDLKANLVADPFRPGFPSNIWVDILNDGCMPVNGTAKLVLDPLTTYASAFPTPDIISADTLIWDFSSLIYDSIHFIPQISLTTTTSAFIGEIVCFELLLYPISGDANPTNNAKNYCFPVVNGYDPNDKKVYPVGECNDKFILADQVMTYTVRFQNTGNAEAVNVYILDSLSAYLDISTLKIVGNSHYLITEILPGNVVKFRFDHIMLPDSTANESASHGYVIFEIQPLPGVLSETVIENQAEIYFDFNEPVMTNTVFNTITATIPDFYSTSNINICNDDSLVIGSHIYTMTGTYIDHFTTSGGCDSTVITYLNVGSFNTLVTQTGETLTAVAESNGYQWVECGGMSPLPGETNQVYIATSNGSYAVIFYGNSCSDTSECINLVSLSDTENLTSIQKLFPNPGDGKLTIITKTVLSNAVIQVKNQTGQIVYSIFNLTGSEFKVDFSMLSKGSYIIEILDGKNVSQVKYIKV